jgi:putative inorganic carbon (hco3(-)) transporter
MAQGVADTVWYRPVLQTLWWLCVGIVASFYRSDEREYSTTENRLEINPQ